MVNKPSNSIVFLRALLAEQCFPDIITGIRDIRNGNCLYERPIKKKVLKDKEVFTIQDVPGYMEMKLGSGHKGLSLQRIQTQSTHLVELDRYPDGDQYMERHFGSKSRSALRRYKKRLEDCFDIRYKVFQGPMDLELYDDIFDHLRSLMVRRFKKKEEENYELPHLDDIKQDLYPMLLEHRANLFVIYANGHPVSIRINMILDKLVFYILSAFDPDFEVFRLGKLDMWQNISWLIGQGYHTYDLLKGYSYIKERWADISYSNDLIMISNDISLKGRLSCGLQFQKARLRQGTIIAMKFLYMDQLFHSLKKLRRNNHKGGDYKISPIEDMNTMEFPKDGRIQTIMGQGPLTTAVIHFAYRYKCSLEDIGVFHDNNGSDQYYIHAKARYYLLKIY